MQTDDAVVGSVSEAVTALPETAQILRLSPEAALAALRTGRDGLTQEMAVVRLGQCGRNELPKGRGVSLGRQLLGELIHFFALMLWVAAGLSWLVGMAQLSVAIVIVIVLNGVFSFFQEYRAERATKSLSSLLPHMAKVVRGGQRTAVPAEELVPGDLLVLREGDRVSTDARIITADRLHVDNAILTGESTAVAVEAGAAASDDVMAAPNLVFAGTFVSSGFGLAVVVATGPHTQLARLSHLTSSVSRRPSPLRVDINRSVRVIAACAMGTGVAFCALSTVLGTSFRNGVLLGVGVIVALVPEGLLPTVTLALAMGARRMARRRALVRHLEAVETLGSTTVICSDKTGTMTANQMTIQSVVAGGKRITVSGVGFSTRGTLLRDEQPLSPSELEQLASFLRAAALCGNATLEQREGRWVCLGDPVEGALVALAAKGGLSLEAAERAAPRVGELAFEATRRRMSTVHRLSSGHFEVLTKGAPEAVLAVCSSVRDGPDAVPLDARRRASVFESVDALARDGLRVLALAHRLSPLPASSIETAETDLELLGLVGVADPVHPEVPAAIEVCRTAGIRVLMLTGDHPATAIAVARAVGLPGSDAIVGSDLPADDVALQALLAGATSVFARITPEQKLRIARALQSRGEVVAMTGDGVNDAPALRQADIGIAMGATGTDVAREAADLVLLDDNFAHIVEAVREGRSVYDNIRRFLTYHLTDNVAELAPFMAWAIAGGAIPLVLSVMQILALDIGTDLLPALALGAEPPAPGTMTRAPRSRSARTLDGRVLARAFAFLGPVQAVLSLSMVPLGAILFLGWRFGSALPKGGSSLSLLSTLVFASIVLMQMVNALECRSTRRSVFRIRMLSNRLLLGAVGFEIIVLAAFVNLPGLRGILGQRPLDLWQWLLAGLAPVLFLGAEELRKAFVRRHQRRRLVVPLEEGKHRSSLPRGAGALHLSSILHVTC